MEQLSHVEDGEGFLPSDRFALEPKVVALAAAVLLEVAIVDRAHEPAVQRDPVGWVVGAQLLMGSLPARCELARPAGRSGSRFGRKEGWRKIAT